MKQWCIHFATFLIVTAIIGGLVVVSGIVPIKASSGHWKITRQILSFAQARSVATHSQGIEIPNDLDDPAMVIRGAGHFETACAGCHGSPTTPSLLVAQQMTPTPPNLPKRVNKRTAAELFYVTKHGIKLTGMPAFASQLRDDEIWAVTGFLTELPDLDKASYRKLVFVDESEKPQGVPQIVLKCARCHGYDGRGRGRSAFPKLDRLHREYFVATLEAYADGSRHSGIMQSVAHRLDAADISQLADYYPNRSSADAAERQDNPPEVSEDVVARGKEIAMNGLANQNVGACVSCHAQSRGLQNPSYPYLAGQPVSYLVNQLKLLKADHRGGTEFVNLMKPHVAEITEQQMHDVASFYAFVDHLAGDSR